jgi:hypothetical protein
MAIPILARNYSNTTLPTQLTANIDNQASTTNIPVASTASYPPAPFTGCFERNTINQEFVLVTAIPDLNHFTVVRGYDGTPPAQHLAPATFEHAVGSIDYRDANWHHTDTTRDDHLQYALINGTRAFTGPVSAPGYAANLTGTSGRYVGISNGAPASGTYLINDYSADPTNRCFWFCIAGGSPGTWSSSRLKPSARLQATGQTVLSANTWTQIVLATDHAVGGCTIVAPSSIRVPVAGIYRTSCAILYQTSNNPAGAGRYVAAIYRNGAQVRQYNDTSIGGNAFTQPAGSDTGQYGAGDLITLWGWQNSSGLEGSYGSGVYTNLAVEFVTYLSS